MPNSNRVHYLYFLFIIIKGKGDWNGGCETPTGSARQLEIPQERSDEEVQREPRGKRAVRSGNHNYSLRMLLPSKQKDSEAGLVPSIPEACDWNGGCETPTGSARQLEIPQERSDEEVQREPRGKRAVRSGNHNYSLRMLLPSKQKDSEAGLVPSIPEACDWNGGCETPTGSARQLEIPQERSNEEVQREPRGKRAVRSGNHNSLRAFLLHLI
ncbi:hypothetical protein [Priestia flexa]|uniref:hypothetical protein n=2 Tax=Priestia flexa TaxID=86664 RepID=UPI00119DFF8E|nr:hypothetical protein [Priestia flexa]